MAKRPIQQPLSLKPGYLLFQEEHFDADLLHSGSVLSYILQVPTSIDNFFEVEVESKLLRDSKRSRSDANCRSENIPDLVRQVMRQH